MIHNINIRTVTLDVKSKNIREEIERRGQRCSDSEYSNSIRGHAKTPKAYRVTTLADQILTEWEADKSKIRRD